MLNLYDLLLKQKDFGTDHPITFFISSFKSFVKLSNRAEHISLIDCGKYRNFTWFSDVEILWKSIVSAEFRENHPKLCGNCAFPQNFHPRKLGAITTFYAVIVFLYETFCLSKRSSILLFNSSCFCSIACVMILTRSKYTKNHYRMNIDNWYIYWIKNFT